jgi:hypothetical protein
MRFLRLLPLYSLHNLNTGVYMPTNNNVDSERIKNGVDRAAGTYREAKDSFRDAQDKAGNVVDNVKDTVRDGINSITDTVRQSSPVAMKDVTDMANKAYSQVSDISRDGLKKLESEIKQYPLLAMAGAFGLGLFCGMCRSSR